MRTRAKNQEPGCKTNSNMCRIFANYFESAWQSQNNKALQKNWRALLLYYGCGGAGGRGPGGCGGGGGKCICSLWRTRRWCLRWITRRGGGGGGGGRRTCRYAGGTIAASGFAWANCMLNVNTAITTKAFKYFIGNGLVVYCFFSTLKIGICLGNKRLKLSNDWKEKHKFTFIVETQHLRLRSDR